VSRRGRAAAGERLRHMAEAADAIAGYVARGRAAFDADAAVRDAILYQLVVLGEAAKGALAADPSLEADFPDVDWSPAARMRDRVAHHYWATDPAVVWATASGAVPALRRALGDTIAALG
jgi:uncharacterized protein with HEPN domain